MNITRDELMAFQEEAKNTVLNFAVQFVRAAMPEYKKRRFPRWFLGRHPFASGLRGAHKNGRAGRMNRHEETGGNESMFERHYDSVLSGEYPRIDVPGRWTIWRNEEGSISVRRYDEAAS